MTVKELTPKERILKALDEMDENELLKVEKLIAELERQSLIERRIALLDRITGIVSDPEDVRILEEETRRRPLFGQQIRGGEMVYVRERGKP